MRKTKKSPSPVSRDMPVSRFLRLSYFKAPAVASVTPYTIPQEREVVELVTAGTVHFEANGRPEKFGCGTLFWHVAGDETIHKTEAADPYECLALLFRSTVGAARPAPRCSVLSDSSKARELCGEILRIYHNEQVDRSVLGDHVYSRLLWEAHLCAVSPAWESRPTAVEAAMAFVEERFRTPSVGVREMAAAAGLGEAHLHALFRKFVGQTPHQFLTLRRIREARLQLSGTNRTIKTIAGESGFFHIETFYRSFTKTVGMTPAQFRRRACSPVLL